MADTLKNLADKHGLTADIAFTIAKRHKVSVSKMGSDDADRFIVDEKKWGRAFSNEPARAEKISQTRSNNMKEYWEKKQAGNGKVKTTK